MERTGPDQTQTLIHRTDRNGVGRMREAAGLLRLLSQPWPAQRESPVESRSVPTKNRKGEGSGPFREIGRPYCYIQSKPGGDSGLGKSRSKHQLVVKYPSETRASSTSGEPDN